MIDPTDQLLYGELPVESFTAYQPHRLQPVWHKGGDDKQTQTTVQEMSPEQRQILGSLQGLADQLPQREVFQGQRVADQSALTQQGQQATLDALGGVQQSVGQQRQAIQSLLGGGPAGGQQLPGVEGLPQGQGDLSEQFSVNPGQDLNSQFGVTPSSLPEMQGIQGVGAVNEQMQGALAAPITEQLEEQVLPGISSAAGTSGAFGGARQQLLEGQAREDASQQITDSLTRASLQQQQAQAGQTLAQNQQNLARQQQGFGQQLQAGQFGAGLQGQEFGQDLAGAQLGLGAQGQQFGQQLGLQGQLAQQQLAQQGLQQQGILGGLGAAGGVNAQSLIPGQVMGGIGAQNQAQNQAQLDAIRQQFEEGQQAPIDQILQQAGILSGAPAGGGTTTTTTEGGGGGGSALQGALGGAGVGASFGPWGAAAGGILGGLGSLL